MSAKEVVQVSAIVQKLEKERHLKRVLASNAATGTGAVASSESLSSAKSQSTSLDHVAANPSTSTTTSITETESALAAAIRRAAEERKKKAALDLSPPPLPEKMPSTPPTPITPITPATPMAVTSAPGGETHLFKKVAGKWVETGPATALFETTGNGAGVTLSDSDSVTPQPNPLAQRQSMHSKTPQQRPSLTSHAHHLKPTLNSPQLQRERQLNQHLPNLHYPLKNRTKMHYRSWMKC
ncbi:hypothetical protein BCR33DRAFT_343238 [Rhizoclosmatium globosum]|uniref:Uncharacterized protein n=1 Tax=Rhizoclosmatium globosum TaxID=329046 RepID=A0A1Y2C2S9_9FUNG|nr:hypothetical protein BCR33DRAFT_343238 [Rhizoclosmatium globosum]|eukprot:ORY41266.1 hypothetical protein BCR33DRAFT_343238 [Rhizoclosmatium globosum]